jgi:DNA-binding transcriptional LysR family regulator
MGIDVPRLRCITVAAEHRSFRRAAAALNVAQPTLSKRIRDVEEWLGTPLFERSACGAQLTPIGHEIVQSARRVLAELEFMKDRVRDEKRGQAGRLEVGLYTSLSAGFLRESILAFIQQFAQIDVNIVEDGRAMLIPLLDRGAIDIVIALGEPTYPGHLHMSLWSERLMVALPNDHPLAEREFVYWTDLKGERFLMSRRDPGPEIEDLILNKLTSPGDRPIIKQIKASNAHVLSVVNSYHAITVLCESGAGNTLPGIVFREVRDGNGPTRVGYVAYWRQHNDNPALKQMITFLRTHLAVPPAHNGA